LRRPSKNAVGKEEREITGGQKKTENDEVRGPKLLSIRRANLRGRKKGQQRGESLSGQGGHTKKIETRRGNP